MLSAQEIKGRLSGCSGFEGSIKELSSITGVPEKTLYRYKNGLSSYGISIVNLRRGRKSKEEVTTPVKFSFKDEDFRVVLNGIFYLNGLSAPYPSDIVPFKAYENFDYSLSERDFYVSYLQKISQFNFLTQVDRYSIMSAIIQLQLPMVYLSSEDADYYTEVAKRLFGFAPTREQLKAIDNIVKFGNGSFLPGIVSARVEAVAGASKSVCGTIGKTVLEEKYGFKKIDFLSVSSAVASGNLDGKTLAKKFKDLFGVSGDFNSLQDIKNELRFKIVTKTFKKVPFLIVDEHSTLNDDCIDILEASCEKVLFLGDTAQLLRNNSYLGPAIATLSEQFRFINSESDVQKTVTHLHFTKQWDELKRYLKSVSDGTFKGKLNIRVHKGKAELYTDYTDSFNTIYEENKDLIRSLDTQVIAYSKKAVEEFNVVVNGGAEIKEGSIVTLIKYMYKAGKAGQTGGRFIVTRVVGADCTLFSEENGVITVPKSYLELSFAATTNKVQGKGFKTVIFLAGTACISELFADYYSGCTRAVITLKIYMRDEVDIERAKLLNILLPFVEGKRNDKLNKDLYTYFQEALSSGLSADEITNTINSALRGANKGAIKAVNKVLKEVDAPLIEADTHDSAAPEEKTKNYGYVLEVDGREHPLYPRGAQKCKTREQAQYLLDQHLKTGKYTTGYITEELSGGNRVTIDCDSKEAVAIFERFKDITESYYSEDGEKLHVVFKTTRFFPRRIRAEGLACDILGNWLDGQSLRNEKGNKIYNGKEATDLPAEVEELIKQLFGV